MCMYEYFKQKLAHFRGGSQDFLVGGGANPPGGGAPTYDFAKFYEKLHEIEKILGPKSATAL